jgi:cytochrome b561
MEIFNTSSEYGAISKIFHWIMSVLIITLLCVGFYMTDFLDKSLKPSVYSFHKLVGIGVLFIAFARISWLGVNSKPDSISTKRWEKGIEYIVHRLLYALMLFMPVSGWIMSTASNHIPEFYGHKYPMPGIVIGNEGLANSAATLHYVCAWLLVALVSLHIAAAIKHHYFDKDNTLKRML